MNQKSKFNVRSITFSAVMAALVFVFTFTFKIPLGTGYAHLGDTMIFLSLLLIGGRNSSFAAAIGAALADLIGGYAAWILPTFLIKFLMVVIAALIAEKLMKCKFVGYVLGSIAGGAFQIAAYTAAKYIMYSGEYALLTLPELALQTVVGISAAIVLILVLQKSGASKALRSMAKIQQGA